MTTRLYYLLSFLPVLPPLGETPPNTVEEILEIIRIDPIEEASAVAGVFEFEVGLLQAVRDKFLSDAWNGSLDSPFGALSQPVVDAFLKDPKEMGEEEWFTELWMAYLVFLKEVGGKIGSALLSGWADFEISLRRQLAAARLNAAASSVELEDMASSGTAVGAVPPVSDPVDLPGMGDMDHGNLIAEWRDAADPMVGERLLDEARMQFIEAEAKYYSFGIDELVAYFLKLGLLSRYARLNREEGLKILEEVTAL